MWVVLSKQSMYTRKSFENKITLKDDYQETLKKLIWLFSLHPAPFYEQDYGKKGPKTTQHV